VLNQRLLRQGDEVFTIVRDPADMVVSQVNYVLTKLGDSAGQQTPVGPDIRRYLRVLGLERFEPDQSSSTLLELARRILHDPGLVPDNQLCRSLGLARAEAHTSAQAAYDNLIIANVEITDTQRYARWLQSKFGIVSKTRRNVSRAVLSRDTLTPADVDYIESIVTEDRKVYARIQAALARSDAPCVMADKLDLTPV